MEAFRRVSVFVFALLVLIASPSHAATPACGSNAGDEQAIADLRTAAATSCPCDSFDQHSQYVSCFIGVVKQFISDGQLPAYCKQYVTSFAARRSTCGRKPGAVTCCKPKGVGLGSCSIADTAAKCSSLAGGTASVGTTAACIDACPDPPTPSPVPSPTPSPTSSAAAKVCQRWNQDQALIVRNVSWTGSVTSCTAGDISPAARQSTVTLVNLYRYLAGLPSVSDNATLDRESQACALMMDANGLSHSPPPSWKCYSADGALAAGRSNLATTDSVDAVSYYMADFGNASTVGHRRWILSNGLGPIGVGSTPFSSCLWVVGGSAPGGRAWTAWPPPGPVPVVALWGADSIGWTIQSDSIDLKAAKVKIDDGGTSLPVAVSQLGGGYGSAYAIAIKPRGWSSTAGHTYQVSVTGVASGINYSVMPVQCP